MASQNTTKGPVSREKVFKAILGGIKKSQTDHYNMTGSGMWEGPEYWITTYVGRSLWKLCGDGYVVLESGSNSTLDDAGRKSGRPPLVVKNKRYDIVLYFSNETPRAVIEIKNEQPQKAVLKDVDRVVAALKSTELRFGAVGYFYSASGGKNKSAREKVRDYCQGLTKCAVETAVKDNFKAASLDYVSGDTNDAWLAGCIKIERKQGNKQRK